MYYALYNELFIIIIIIIIVIVINIIIIIIIIVSRLIMDCFSNVSALERTQ